MQYVKLHYLVLLYFGIGAHFVQIPCLLFVLGEAKYFSNTNTHVHMRQAPKHFDVRHRSISLMVQKSEVLLNLLRIVTESWLRL